MLANTLVEVYAPGGSQPKRMKNCFFITTSWRTGKLQQQQRLLKLRKGGSWVVLGWKLSATGKNMGITKSETLYSD